MVYVGVPSAGRLLTWLDRAGLLDVPRARVVVLDGNALSPGQPWRRGRTTVRTLWGDLAWQLGGREGYDTVAASEEAGTSPGKELLVALLGRAACDPGGRAGGLRAPAPQRAKVAQLMRDAERALTEGRSPDVARIVYLVLELLHNEKGSLAARCALDQQVTTVTALVTQLKKLANPDWYGNVEQPILVTNTSLARLLLMNATALLDVHYG